MQAVYLEPGATIETGTKIAKISGQIISALYTAEPLYQDVVLGDAGPNIEMLRTALREDGVEVGASGPADIQLQQALEQLLDRPSDDDLVLAVSEIAWLPVLSASVQQLYLTPGIDAPPPALTSALLADIAAAKEGSAEDYPVAARATTSLNARIVEYWSRGTAAVPTSSLLVDQSGVPCLVLGTGPADAHAHTVAVLASNVEVGTTVITGVADDDTYIVNPRESDLGYVCGERA